jgi:hypothetical protein
MDASPTHHRLQVRVHQLRIAETAPPRSRDVAAPTGRRLRAGAGRAARRAARAARRLLVVPGPEPVRGAAPAMLGRHPLPELPPCP